MLKLLSPHNFLKITQATLPWLGFVCVATFLYGLYLALVVSPGDYQQGQMVRIMYVHVPAAWMSLGIYMFIGCCSFSSIVWRTKLSYLLAISAAPIGATFALITLVTGSLWGHTMWGTWWVWDARLTSMLVLFLLYLGYIAVVNSGDDLYRAEKPAAVVALIGAVNVPIVKFSVDIWNSLHQPASIIRSGGIAIDKAMLLPLMVMFLAFILYFLAMVALRCGSLINNMSREKI
jgi:heme exporter protein C